jgi:hypothetical protein
MGYERMTEMAMRILRVSMAAESGYMSSKLPAEVVGIAR